MRLKAPSLLGPDGRPIQRLQSFSMQGDNVAGHYDVAQTVRQNAEHWGLALAGDANTSFDYERRRKSRLRARYETANNAHLRGMVETRACDTIGDGPNLQMLSDGGQEIEAAWHSWAQEVSLTDKLLTLWAAGKQVDGEGIAVLQESMSIEHEVQLDVVLLESEQIGNPNASADTENIYDGIRHDSGRPVAYYIYDHHPDAYAYGGTGSYIGQWYDPSRVLHCFRKYRIGQLRGATELGPALEFAAILRRYTLATLNAAEVASSISLWLETDASSEDGPQSYEGGAFQSFPVTRNLVITAPYGWHAKQIKAEQPVDQYDKFVRAIVTQMGRSIGMPAALSYGDSSDYNMASGRLDFQTYIRAIETDRKAFLEPAILEKIFLIWLRIFAAMRSGISPSSISRETLKSEYPHRWAYRPINHSDPEKQAQADVAMWEIGLLTDDEYLYRRNIDPETHYTQLKKQTEQRTALGMRLPGMMPGMPGTEGQEEEQEGGA